MSRLSCVIPRFVRRKIILSRMNVELAALARVRVKIVETEAESVGAARLVHDSYVARGILTPHSTRVYASKFSASPATWTAAAVLGDDVIGTVSLVCDQGGSLPMDPIYGAELRTFRATGERLAEIGALAIHPRYRKSGLVHWLNRIMFLLAGRLGIDRLVIAVHPDAGDIYRESLLFTEFGPERAYPGLNPAARAVALSVPLADLEARWEREFGHHGERPCNPAWLVFRAIIPQVELPGDMLIPRNAARRALRRARPDVVPPRPSLASYVDMPHANGIA